MSGNVQEVIDRLAILDLHARYCRALDRMDKASAYGVFFQDSTANYHGIFKGSGHGFVDWVWVAHQQLERHSHQIANTLIEVDGDCAVSEAYVTVALWTLPDEDGSQQEIVCRGRYLDRMARRVGGWGIVAREHVVDMHSVSTLDRAEISDCSSRDLADASWKFFHPLKE